MSGLLGLLIASLIVALPSILIIWIVGRLKLGLEVDGFGSAFLVGLIIAIVAGIVTFLLSTAGIQDSGGLVGGIVHMTISFACVLVSARLLPRVKVNSYTGVLVAAAAIGAFYWLGGLVLGRVIG